MKIWINNNRCRYKSGQLSKERMEKLDAIHILEIRFFRSDETKALIASRPRRKYKRFKPRVSEDEKRTKTLSIKLTDDEYAALKQKAKDEDYTKFSTYARLKLLDKA